MASRDCAEKTTCTEWSSVVPCVREEPLPDTYRKLDGKSLHSKELAGDPASGPLADVGADEMLLVKKEDQEKRLGNVKPNDQMMG